VDEPRWFSREQVAVGAEGEAIEVLRWNAPHPAKPTALLLHGTGFTAEVWQDFALPLCASHSVLGIDRRGHGRSHKPGTHAYHFADFAQDLCAVIEALDLRDIYGIGHSAGATDLLLTAAALPSRFTRIFALEPTAMQLPAASASVDGKRFIEEMHAATLRRKVELASAKTAYERYRDRPPFASWTASALWSYLRSGFEHLSDGRLRLLCLPEIEVAMLGPIGEVMLNTYVGDARGQPFEMFAQVNVPVCISTSEHSGAVYKRMAAAAVGLLPRVSTTHFAGLGHCAVQEAPERVLAEVLRFMSVA
jgi:pimeloyl-ACP methyl ester carboxylesterase